MKYLISIVLIVFKALSYLFGLPSWNINLLLINTFILSFKLIPFRNRNKNTSDLTRTIGNILKIHNPIIFADWRHSTTY